MKLLRNLPFIALVLLFPAIVLAQTTTATMASSSTIAPSLDQLLDGGAHIYDLVKGGAIIAALICGINVLVNISKFKPVREFITRKKLKWLRPLAALAIGFLGGLGHGINQGLTWYLAVLYAAGGMFTGAGAVVLHEIYAGIRGERG